MSQETELRGRTSLILESSSSEGLYALVRDLFLELNHTRAIPPKLARMVLRANGEE
jgi:hypothetical protein